MYSLWTPLRRFFNKLTRKSRKSVLVNGESARHRAFLYFMQGLRPSQLPPLGVPKSTIYRYHQAFKHRWEDSAFRLARRRLVVDQDLRKTFAERLGVPSEEFDQALKGCRSKAQLRKKLRLDDAEQLNDLIERTEEIDLARLVKRVRACKTLEGKKRSSETKRVSGMSAKLNSSSCLESA